MSHSRGRCDANVNLKPLEKSFDRVKEVDKLISAGADIFSCLKVRGLKSVVQSKGTTKDTDQEKSANSRKNYVCWWECLKGKY